MIVIAAVFCLLIALLAGGLLLLEVVFRLLPWGLAIVAWTLEILVALGSAAVAVSRAVRRRGSPRSALRATA